MLLILAQIPDSSRRHLLLSQRDNIQFCYTQHTSVTVHVYRREKKSMKVSSELGKVSRYLLFFFPTEYHKLQKTGLSAAAYHCITKLCSVWATVISERTLVKSSLLQNQKKQLVVLIWCTKYLFFYMFPFMANSKNKYVTSNKIICKLATFLFKCQDLLSDIDLIYVW